MEDTAIKRVEGEPMKRRTRAQLRGRKVARVPRIIYDPTAMKAIELLRSRGYRAEDVALVMGAGRAER